MGKAFSTVFAITVCATVFSQGFKLSGLLDVCFSAVLDNSLATWGFAVIPFLTAILTGSSDAVTLTINQNFLPVSNSLGLTPDEFGLLVAQAAQHGRVISPVAGATLIVCALAGTVAKAILMRLFFPFLFATVLIVFLYS